MDDNTLRAVAIVFNLLLIGFGIFILASSGPALRNDEIVLALLVFFAPGFSLAALLRRRSN
jgi:hypothetical protein